jgi:hypothetical protein
LKIAHGNLIFTWQIMFICIQTAPDRLLGTPQPFYACAQSDSSQFRRRENFLSNDIRPDYITGEPIPEPSAISAG